MQDIVRTLQLWCEDGQVYELRIPKPKRRGVLSGHFDDPNALAINADTLSEKEPTIAQRRVELATGAADIWRSTAGDVWASVEVDRHQENHPVRSASFRRWLTGWYWESRVDTPNDKAVKGAVEVMEHLSQKGEEHRANRHIAVTVTAPAR